MIGQISTAKGAKTNRFLLSDEERIKEDVALKNGYNYKIPQEYREEVEPTERVARIGRAIERAREEELATELPTPEIGVMEEPSLQNEEVMVSESPMSMSFRNL
jgi:NAD-specific glutamate dehydrogenase